MKQRISMWMLFVLLAVAIQPLRAEVLEKNKKVAGTTVNYKVVLPSGFDPAKTYPAILAFGGGPQTMNTIDREILSLRHFEQLTNSETAQVLGLREDAASQRYGRALVRLKDMLLSIPGFGESNP